MAGGRPSKFKPEFVELTRKVAALGATDREIADILGVDERTLYRWRNTYPDFCQALKVGKDDADDRVEKALFTRALGYSHDDVHITTYEGRVTLTPIVKQYPPETVAGIFWLKNRRPDKWREKREENAGDATELAAVIRGILAAADAES